MKLIHHRMPVILKPTAFESWLNPDNQNVNVLQEIIIFIGPLLGSSQRIFKKGPEYLFYRTYLVIFLTEN